MEKEIRRDEAEHQYEFSLCRLRLGGWIEPYAEPESAFRTPPLLADRLVRISSPWPERERARSVRRAFLAEKASPSAAQSDGGSQKDLWMRVRGFTGAEIFPDAPMEPFPRRIAKAFPEWAPMTPPSSAVTPASPAPSS